MKWNHSVYGSSCGLEGLNSFREALRAEGMSAEFMFFERHEDGDYVTLYTRAKNLLEANKSFESSHLAIDQEAKKIKAETWDLGLAKQV